MTSPLNDQVKARTRLHVTYGLPQNRYSKGVNEMVLYLFYRSIGCMFA